MRSGQCPDTAWGAVGAAVQKELPGSVAVQGQGAVLSLGRAPWVGSSRADHFWATRVLWGQAAGLPFHPQTFTTLSLQPWDKDQEARTRVIMPLKW